LNEFRKARIELDASWAAFSAERGRNDALRKEATEQAEAAKSGIGVSPVELDLRLNEISQRPEFVSSYYRQMEAKLTVPKLRDELQIPLSRLAVRHPEAKAVREQLDRLPPELSAQDADIIIGLLEEVLDRSTAGPTGPTGQLDAGLAVKPSTTEGVNAHIEEATAPASFQQIPPLSETEHSTAPATADQTLTGESVGAPDSSREERLSRFRLEHRGTTFADIRYSAEVYKPDFQAWRRGELKADSVMSERIEDVLSGGRPLKKKPPKPRPA
jgi:hypothetical protein